MYMYIQHHIHIIYTLNYNSVSSYILDANLKCKFWSWCIKICEISAIRCTISWCTFKESAKDWKTI